MEFIKRHKKTTLIAIATLIALILILVVIGGVHSKLDKTSDAPVIEETGFQTVIPSGKTISQLGGWQRISPLNTAPVYAYADKIGDVTISVSQQPLPTSFAGSVDEKVSELATAYSATNTLDAEGVKVYIGTSAKGPQSTIFTKNDLLILIKSQENIDNESWIRYITSLR